MQAYKRWNQSSAYYLQNLLLNNFIKYTHYENSSWDYQCAA